MSTGATTDPPPASSSTPTGSLGAPAAGASPSAEPPAARRLASGYGFAARLGELVIFIVAIVGAVALGLGISDYFASHPYVAAYLTAFAAFRLADLLVRDDKPSAAEAVRLARRVMIRLPVLMLFAAGPFERTYLYGGEAPKWLAALGLLIELCGMWLALGARIQLGFFSFSDSGEPVSLVRGGLYRYIRHPIFLGEFLVLFAWPFEYGAPVVGIITLIAGVLVLRRSVKADEAEMRARFGDEYTEYMRTTDCFLPNVW